MTRALVADDLRVVHRNREYEYSRVARGAVVAAATAAGLNLVVYLVARAAGVPFTGRFNPAAPETVVALRDVVGASIVWVIPASAGLLVLNRFMERPFKVLVIGATAFGLLSVLGPLTFPESTPGTRLALALMHLILTAAIVGAIVVWGFSRRASRVMAKPERGESPPVTSSSRGASALPASSERR
jgi:Family of unknown function (DUF6069)